jgi:cytidylate kinase
MAASLMKEKTISEHLLWLGCDTTKMYRKTTVQRGDQHMGYRTVQELVHSVKQGSKYVLQGTPQMKPSIYGSLISFRGSQVNDFKFLISSTKHSFWSLSFEFSTPH